jgi:hypothetical protein
MNDSSGVPLEEAAQRLGIRVEALRKRLQRGKTLQGYKQNGQWYVILPRDVSTHGQTQVDETGRHGQTRVDETGRHGQTQVAVEDQFLQDGRPSGSLDASPHGQIREDMSTTATLGLFETLRSENSWLKEEQSRLWEQLHEKDDQLREKDQQITEKDRQISAWIDEAKRKDMLLAHLQERIVELPSGPQDAPERQPEPHEEPQVSTQMYRVLEPSKKPWWKFWQ